MTEKPMTKLAQCPKCGHTWKFEQLFAGSGIFCGYRSCKCRSLWHVTPSVETPDVMCTDCGQVRDEGICCTTASMQDVPRITDEYKRQNLEIRQACARLNGDDVPVAEPSASVDPFGWWDTFNECFYRQEKYAKRAQDGGNTVIALYRASAPTGGEDDGKRSRSLGGATIHDYGGSGGDARNCGVGDGEVSAAPSGDPVAVAQPSMSAEQYYRTIWRIEHADDVRGDWPIRMAEAYASQQCASLRDEIERLKGQLRGAEYVILAAKGHGGGKCHLSDSVKAYEETYGIAKSELARLRKDKEGLKE